VDKKGKEPAYVVLDVSEDELKVVSFKLNE